MRRLIMPTLTSLLVSSSCYRTVVRPPGAVEGAVKSDRQLFTLGGLVPLSNPAGLECGQNGLAWAESQMDVTDVLIYLGLTVGGALLGGATCPGKNGGTDEDAKKFASCVSGFGLLVPIIISTRTVTYSCNGTAPPPLPTR